MNASDGQNFLELDYVNRRDGFYQDVQTVSGQSYTLTFDARLRAGVSAATQAIEVVWNGVVITTVTPGSSTAWQGQSVQVTGTGGLDRLTIREVAAQGNDGAGALLDNFALVSNAAPPATQLAISGAPSLAEGDSGTTAFTFTVTRTGDTSGVTTVNYAVTGSGGNAANAADFGGALPSGVVTFAAGETTRTITVATTGDTQVEADETFIVTLSSPSAGAGIGSASAAGVIRNDDAPASGANLLVNGSFENPAQGAGTFAAHVAVPGWTALADGRIETWRSLGGVNASDGQNLLELDYLNRTDGFYQDVQTVSGQTYTLTFDARLRAGSAASTQAIEVLWNGVLVRTITPGSSASWQVQSLQVTGTGGLDRLTIREPAAQGGDGLGALLDNFALVANAAPPATQLAISGASGFPEGDSGTTNFTFTVTRTGDTSGVTTVNYAVTGAGANAADAADFGGALPSGVVTFAAGATTRTITVAVTGDASVEADETFTVTLASPSAGASIATAATAGLIANDDVAAPAATQLAISGAPSIAEGDRGTTAFTFTVTRTGDVSGVTSVSYAVAGAGANAANAADFGGALPKGVVTFAAGETSRTVTIAVAGDALSEANERFVVTLSNPSAGAEIGTASAEGVILNDDALAPPGANLLVNGSFENPAQGAGTFAAHVTVPGWTALADGRIETWRSLGGVNASDGQNLLELDYLNRTDGFYQDVQTVSGQSYTLTFDARLRAGVPATTQQVEVVWNGIVVGTITPGSATAWQAQSLQVTGTGGLDRLTIREVASQGGDGVGALLDNFALVSGSSSPTPPSSTAIAFGAGVGLAPVDTADVRANTLTAGNQQASSVAALEGGGFVVTWTSVSEDMTSFNIRAQRFGANGAPADAELQVSAAGAGGQNFASVAALEGGGFVVIWSSFGLDGSGFGIYAQRFDAAGSPVSAETRVNSVTIDEQMLPSVAALDGGGFVVAWTSNGQDGAGFGIYAQRFNASGVAVGSKTRVNTFSANNQLGPAVAALDGGGYVITWSSTGQDGDNSGVYFQRYDAAGAAVGVETPVNTFTLGFQEFPSIAALAGGGFVISWSSLVQDGSGYGVYAQIFNSAGQPVGSEFPVNGFTNGDQLYSSVAALEDGGFVVSWSSNGQDGSGYGVYARRFDSSGAPEGVETRINAATDGDQINNTGNSDPALAVDAEGVLIQTFSSGGDVFIRRLATDTAFTGVEDGGPIAFPIIVSPPTGAVVTETVLTGLPAGSVLSAGTASNGGAVWTISGPPPQNLTFTPPTDFNGVFTLTVTVATELGGQSATASANRAVSVTPMDDTPFTLDFSGVTGKGRVVDLAAGWWSATTLVMPLGDSNTQGFAQAPFSEWQAYRYDLWRLVTDGGDWLDFVGGVSNGPAAFPDPEHQGVSGITATTVVGQATRLAQNHRPDVVLMMLGTNDIFLEANPVGTIPGELLSIIRSFAAEQPDVTFVVSDLLPIADTNLNAIVLAVNALIPGVVAQAQAEGIDAVFSPLPAVAFNELFDGAHPTPAAHARIAQAWYDQLVANDLLDQPQTTFSGMLNVIGADQADLLRGDASANVIAGGGGADRIEGLGGADTLTGGAGADMFFFGAASQGGDTITDFTSGTDRLFISASGFGGGLIAGGMVSLVQGLAPVAAGSGGQFLFETGASRLLWDVDGGGAQTPVLIATLTGVAALAAGDWSVVG